MLKRMDALLSVIPPLVWLDQEIPLACVVHLPGTDEAAQAAVDQPSQARPVAQTGLGLLHPGHQVRQGGGGGDQCPADRLLQRHRPGGAGQTRHLGAT